MSGQKWGMHPRTREIQYVSQVRDVGQYGEWSWCNDKGQAMEFVRDSAEAVREAALRWHADRLSEARDVVSKYEVEISKIINA